MFISYVWRSLQSSYDTAEFKKRSERELVLVVKALKPATLIFRVWEVIEYNSVNINIINLVRIYLNAGL